MKPSFPAANAHFCRELSVGVTFLYANATSNTELSEAVCSLLAEASVSKVGLFSLYNTSLSSFKSTHVQIL